MTKAYPIKNLGCAACAAKMEQKISALPGVKAARVNFMTRKLTLEAEEQALEAAALLADSIIRKVEPGASLGLTK